MAKSVRASVSKRNRANLRKKVFGPVVDARTERLAAKLQELASQPRPEAPEKSKMDLEDDSGMSLCSIIQGSWLTSYHSQPRGNCCQGLSSWCRRRLVYIITLIVDY
jgi:hypothetical protein